MTLLRISEFVNNHQVSNNSKKIDPLDGLEFLLSHFPQDKDIEAEPLFPRRASTAITENSQRDIFSKEHLLAFFEYADWIDTKLNAYPNYTLLASKGKKPVGYVPHHWLLFIDQEHGDISTTLHNIKIHLGGATPTVLWSGHGYHIYVPLTITDKEILDDVELAVDYLRFIEKFVSDGQKDKGHFPSFNSSMLRIPGSFNQSCILEGREPSDVRILQAWDGYRATPSTTLLEKFMHIQRQKRLKELKEDLIADERARTLLRSGAVGETYNVDPLTEFLIFESRGIADGRKNMLYYVIARYLIRNKGLPRHAAEDVCWTWLNHCSSVSSLKRYRQFYRYHIKHCIQDAIVKNKEAFSVEYLKHLNQQAYADLMAEYEERHRKNNITKAKY
jgi:hypothetical protein